MKKKVLSLLLSTAMVASLAACGSAADTGSTDTQSSDTAAQSGDATATTETAEAPAEDYELTDLYITVDGTLTANVDNGQDAFIEQWEEAVSEKLGHPITLHINQPEHSGYNRTAW